MGELSWSERSRGREKFVCYELTLQKLWMSGHFRIQEDTLIVKFFLLFNCHTPRALVNQLDTMTC